MKSIIDITIQQTIAEYLDTLHDDIIISDVQTEELVDYIMESSENTSGNTIV